MSAANQLPTMMTVVEFLDWVGPDGSERWELVDGVPRAMAPASQRHALITTETGRLIGNHLEKRPECRVAIEAGVQPQVNGSTNVRVPDLTVACAGDVGSHLVAEPLVIIEVLSPSNRADTWGNVWTYVTIPSVREILILHSMEVRAELLRRDAAGGWPADPLTLHPGDDVTLESIDFSAPLAAFYRTADV